MIFVIALFHFDISLKKVCLHKSSDMLNGNYKVSLSKDERIEEGGHLFLCQK
jgi:hypothetical protein